jgi:hypothetical protein
MQGLYFLLPTFLVIIFSFLIVRATAIALMLTDMSWEKALFQALSAFTGTGFTTKEAENVMKHPTRRKIISWLMILGNAGIVTVIVTTTSSLFFSRGVFLSLDIVILILGIYLIYKLATIKGFTRKWEDFIRHRLRLSEILEEAETEDLLHFIEGYGVARLLVKSDSNLIGNRISSLKLPKKTLLVLGIERKNKWIPVPSSREKIKEKDNLILYGPLKTLKQQIM